MFIAHPEGQSFRGAVGTSATAEHITKSNDQVCQQDPSLKYERDFGAVFVASQDPPAQALVLSTDIHQNINASLWSLERRTAAEARRVLKGKVES